MAQSEEYCGLDNPDSTCYLNSVLQTLFMIEEFREHVKSDLSSDNFIKELKKLFIELEKQQKTAVSTAEVTKSLNIINVDKQADAAEILHSILRKTPGSYELFEVKMTKRACWKCRDKQEPLENLLSLTVSFEDSQDVETALKAYVGQTCGEYQLNCSQCKVTTVWKSEIINFPKILIIQLERLEMSSSGFKKSDRKVKIHPHIEVSSHKYELYAIIYHTGAYDGGHYYVDIECEGQIWRRFDDKSVSESPINAVFLNESSTLSFRLKHRIRRQKLTKQEKETSSLHKLERRDS